MSVLGVVALIEFAETEMRGTIRDPLLELELCTAAIARALLAAAAPPAAVTAVAEAVVSLAEALLPVANPSVITNVAAATEAARAAATTARLNVEINLRGIHDDEVGARLAGVLDLVGPLVARTAAVESAVREMVG